MTDPKLTPLTDRMRSWLVTITWVGGSRWASNEQHRQEFAVTETTVLEALTQALADCQEHYWPDPDEDGDILGVTLMGVEVRPIALCRVQR